MFCPLVLKLPSPQGLCFRLWGCLLLPSYDPRFDSLLRLLIFLWLCWVCLMQQLSLLPSSHTVPAALWGGGMLLSEGWRGWCAEWGSAWLSSIHIPGGQALLGHSWAQSLTCLAVMQCDREKSNVCIYAFLNYSRLSAETHCLFSLLMRASLLRLLNSMCTQHLIRKANSARVSLRGSGGSLCSAFRAFALGSKQPSWKCVWFCSSF